MCKGGKYKYGKIKYGYARMENASMENSSTSEQGQYYSTYSVLYRLVGSAVTSVITLSVIALI